MAKIEVSPKTGAPRCPGCGAELYYLPVELESRAGPWPRYHPRHAWLGSMGPQVKEFAEEHAQCPDPFVERLPSGMLFVNRRGARL